MLWHEVAGNVLYYATLPTVKLLLFLVYVLRLLLSPFIYTATVFVQLCLIPYNIAAKFEVCRPLHELSPTDRDRLFGISSLAPSSSAPSADSCCTAFFESSSYSSGSIASRNQRKLRLRAMMSRVTARPESARRSRPRRSKKS